MKAVFLLSQAEPPRGSQKPGHRVAQQRNQMQRVACFVVRKAVPLGLRVYRCRIVAPPQHATGATVVSDDAVPGAAMKARGVKQNVSNPFKPLELVAEMPISQALDPSLM